MAKQLKINVDSYTFWWLDLNDDNNGLMEIKTYLDALLIASSVDYAIHLYARRSKANVNVSSSNVATTLGRSVGAGSGGDSEGGVAMGQGVVSVEECVEDGEED